MLVTTKDVQLYLNWNIIQDEELHLKLDMNLNPKPNLELNLKLNLAPNMKMCGYQKQKVSSVHRFQLEDNGLKIAVYRLQFADCRLLVATKNIDLSLNLNIVQDEDLHLKLNMDLNLKPNLETKSLTESETAYLHILVCIL